METLPIFLGVAVFTAIVLALVGIILVAKARLVASGDVHITVNGEKDLIVRREASCSARWPTTRSSSRRLAAAAERVRSAR